MEVPDATGIILAGGYSERFGAGNKALAKFRNHPLIYHVTREVLKVTPSVLINCRADQRSEYTRVLAEFDEAISFAIDSDPGAGPLYGLETACDHCDTSSAIVLACDMPLVDSKLLAYLLQSLESDAVIPQTTDGWRHLTHAAYRIDPLRDAITQAKRNGKDRLQDLCTYLKFTTLHENQIEQVSDIATLTSIDSNADLTTLQQE